MTPDEAADLAARALAAIDTYAGHVPGAVMNLDRERVASDLEGVQAHRAVEQSYGDDADTVCDCCLMNVEDGPCPDAARYADGLRRTAALYGVTP